MSQKNSKDGRITLNITPNGDYTFTGMTYSFSTIDLTGAKNSAIVEYEKIDAEFDKLDDQTSIARELLNGIGIKC